MSNVIEFPPKSEPIDPSNVPQWIMAYATLITEIEEERRPKNLVIIELYEGEEATSHNMWMCGPDIKGLTLIGLLEMVKSAIASDQLGYHDDD